MMLDLVQGLRGNPMKTSVGQSRIAVDHGSVSERHRDSIPRSGEQVGGNGQFMRDDTGRIVLVQTQFDSGRPEETFAQRVLLVDRYDETISDVEQDIANVPCVLHG
ncbi:MAG: hypothetical protein KJS66_01695 [Acidobacteria bacterium]|nr:hypothetical protein [Acidobacteriota bacterium]